LLVHQFEAPQSLRRLEFELLADQALIDCRLSRARFDDQLDSSRSKGSIQGRQAGIRVGPLELRYGCLADLQSLSEGGLGETCAPPCF
jgi:hypothetical protein